MNKKHPKYPEYRCSRCGGVLNELVKLSIGVAYDKCRDKKCPDCSKIRKLGAIKMTLFDESIFVGSCPKCKKIISAEFDGLCQECFWERERKRGCICIKDRWRHGKYYCPICEEIHILGFKCRECIDKINKGLAEVELPWGGMKARIPVGKSEKLVSPWKIIVPSTLGGFVIGAIIGFLITRVILKKKNQKK